MSKEVKNEVATIEQPTTKPEVVSQTTTKLLKEIQDGLKDTAKAFVRIGVSLNNFKEDRLYKELGYKNFESFVKAEFHLSKASAYTFISIALKFTVLTAEGFPTLVLKKEFRQFSSSQLCEMLRLDEDTIAKVKPTDTIRDIKKLKESVQTSEQDNEDGNKESSGKPKAKASEKDFKVPVNRLFVGSVDSFEDIAMHEKYLRKLCNDTKREKDGKNYRIEINIIWDDLSSDSESQDVSSSMNAPESEDGEQQ